MDAVSMIHERLRGQFPDLLGMRLIEATPELVKASLEVRPELCTVGAILHGGAIMAFADTLGAVATVLNLPPDARTVTIESKTNFLGPARAGSQVIGECTPLHRGKTTMIWQTRVLAEDGKLVAFVSQTQLVLK
ncbi:MAG: PaaI family thioesterase [Roseiflexaceae bacterium]